MSAGPIYNMLLTLLALLLSGVCVPAYGERGLAYETDVRPIFKQQCFHCHGEEDVLPGGLDVRLVRLLKVGGDSGAAIVPGDADTSLLWQRIAADEMPNGPKKLTDSQKLTIRRWIDEGARTARPEPTDVADARFSYEELSHWAYQPVYRPVIPRPHGYDPRTGIDGFVGARLADHGLSFSSVADRRTLIRRVTFDLLGLPPTLADIERFVADEAPDAYEQLVDRLLDSPHFGVRWARHWLDVAGYAETNGGPGGDSPREYAWRYRDYVIDAFNNNKSIDQFYLEQLAGDELIDGPLDIQNPRHLEWLTATGFLRMAPDPTQENNSIADRNMAVADAMQIISSAMLGLTVGCAQCHDHKYDPIAIDDYYRFRAVFDPAFPLESWQVPNERLVDLTTEESKTEADRIEAECVQMEQALSERRNAHAARIYEQKLADVPVADQTATRSAIETAEGERTEEQKELLDQYPMVKTVSFIAGFLVEYDNATYREFEKEAKKIGQLRSTKPSPRMVMATQERPGEVPVSAVFFRGNPTSARGTVTPGEINVLTRHGRDVVIPQNDPDHETTGRRLAYARQLTDGTHPLAARVFVNRVWMHHFGRGLVETPNDFGISGDPPTHPQLLDWLANDFTEHGWNHKSLHRMIVLSTTYRQSSLRRADTQQIDPENRLLARMNLRRLDAEAIRDAIHSMVGQLDSEIGGPSVPVTENLEGKVVIDKSTFRDGLKAGVDGNSGDETRRSTFIQVQRKRPLNMLATFDQPRMNPNCDVRRATTVATQSLWFLNDVMIVACSEQLARRVVDDFASDDERINQLFVRMFAAEPTPLEKSACQSLVAVQREHFAGRIGKEEDSDASPEWRAYSVLCQTLFASNRFLYVD